MGEDLNTPERIGQPITTPPAVMDVIEPEVSESSASEPIVETRTLNPLNPSTDEQTEDEQEIIQQARSVIDELRLGFLIKEVKIGEIPDIHGQSHKRLADGYIQCYPDGAVIVESSYFMPSEQRAHLVRHEVGHIMRNWVKDLCFYPNSNRLKPTVTCLQTKTANL